MPLCCLFFVMLFLNCKKLFIYANFCRLWPAANNFKCSKFEKLKTARKITINTKKKIRDNSEFQLNEFNSKHKYDLKTISFCKEINIFCIQK